MRPRRLLLALPLLAAGTFSATLVGCATGATSTSASGGITTASTTPPQDVRVVSDIAYQAGLGSDLYLPTEQARDTVIVWIHGGGFVAGGKNQLASLAKELARQGYPGMAIEYRLSTTGSAWFPATTLEDPGLQAAAANAVEDTLHAVSWLRSPAAATYGLKPRTIVLAGYSAGAITAATAAATDPAAFDGAVSLAGAAIEPDQLSSASPPLLMIHGDTDDIVPVDLARATCDAATANGGRCTLDVLAGRGHEFPFERTSVVVDDLMAFLAQFG